MRVCAYVCAHAPTASQRARRRVRVRAERRAARDGDLSSREHSAHVYQYMYACAHVQMCVCARRMHPSAGVRVRRRERASTNCVSLRTFYIDVYLYMNVGTYGGILACLYVCVGVYYMYIDIYIYIYLQRHIDIYIYMYVYICVYIRTHIYMYIYI
jgi:hypothetical protein